MGFGSPPIMFRKKKITTTSCRNKINLCGTCSRISLMNTNHHNTASTVSHQLPLSMRANINFQVRLYGAELRCFYEITDAVGERRGMLSSSGDGRCPLPRYQIDICLPTEALLSNSKNSVSQNTIKQQ